MRFKVKYLLFSGLIAFSQLVLGQSKKFEFYNDKVEEYRFDNFLVAKLYADSALKLASDLKNDKLVARAYNATANVYSAHAKLKEFKEALIKADQFNKSTGDKYITASILNNWGIYYERSGEYEKSITKHLEALRIRQELKNENQLVASYQNLGAVYFYMAQYDNCEKYTLKAIELNEKLNNKKLQGELYDNLGACYFSEYKDSLAELYMKKSLAIAIETESKIGIENSYNNLAAFYSETGKPLVAKSYLFKAMKNLVSSADRVNSIMLTMGRIYEKTNKPDSALYYYNEALSLAKNHGDIYRQKNAYKYLSAFYFSKKDFEKAYLMQQDYHKLEDSLKSEANLKNIAELEAVYKNEKQVKEIELLNTENKMQKEKTASNQKLLWISLLGLLLALTAAVSFYRNFIRKKKDNVILQEKNTEIQQQKDLIAAKNKEIVDSINYAKRLQEAILPPVESIKKHLPESFVFYKPKDIVAGDFYWMHVAKRDQILIAVADCTGHGVPGAMVSVVCANALNASVKEFGLTEPAKILDKVNELVEETFGKSENEVRDGMDISLLKVEVINDNPDNKLPKGKLIIPKGQSLTDVLEANKRFKVEWAGANNPLWYIKNGEWFEIKADKQPVGKFINRKPFTNHVIELKVNDSLFLISDGFADQFGGEFGKKLKNKALKDLLFKNSDQLAALQKEILEKEFTNWKGVYEQVDDVCIIGIRF